MSALFDKVALLLNAPIKMSSSSNRSHYDPLNVFVYFIEQEPVTILCL